MTDIDALVARLEKEFVISKADMDALRLEAAAALRERTATLVEWEKLDDKRRDYEDQQRTIDTLRAELEAEKAAHWRTCQTAAHEAEERDKAEAALAQLAPSGEVQP